MKRIIIFLLVVMLSGMLSGCSLDMLQNSEAAFQIGDGKREESLLILEIEINPKFELYLDTDTLISAVCCLNEDAKTLFADIDVLKLYYYEAMEKILTAAQEKGFLKAEDKIWIDITAQNGLGVTRYLKDSLMAPIFKFSGEKELGLSVAMPADVSGEATEGETDRELLQGIAGKDESTEQSETTPEGYIVEYVRDENGKVLSRVEKDADGRVHSTLTYTYHANGNQALIVEENADGSRYESAYDENGLMSHSVEQRADGVYIEVGYNPDGTFSTMLNVTADGQRHERTFTYHENGKIATDTSRSSDGTGRDSVYDENGVETYQKEYYSDGTYRENTFTYYPRGSMMTQSMKWSDGRTAEVTFFENSQDVLRSVSTEVNGDQEDITYNADKTIACYIRVVSGVRTEDRYTYHANGKIATQISNSSDGKTMEITNYESGKCASYRTTSADGKFTTETYSESGETTYYETNDLYGGGYEKRTFYENGVRKYWIIEMSDGYRQEASYYPNGNKEWTTINFGDGSSEKETCDEKGNRINWEYIYSDGTRNVTAYRSDGNREMTTYYTDGKVRYQVYDADNNLVEDKYLQ